MGIFYRCPVCNSRNIESFEINHIEKYDGHTITCMLEEVMQCHDCGNDWKEMYSHSYSQDFDGKIYTKEN